jgi:thiosulfate/3-mercaptopyruvate sulfurtransferase
MPSTTLIAADELAHAIDRCLVVDCRHDLSDLDAGRRAYDAGHLPGAFFLHMDEDLSAPTTGRNGRHPLPTRERVRDMLASLGLADDRQLVAYDAQGGAMASRLWWMARWVGHEATAVLDGGLAAWTRAGYPLVTDVPSPTRGRLSARPPLGEAVDAAAVAAMLGAADRLLLDARAPERYRGEVEPLDPVAGHIPGALNRPWQSNLREDGRFKPAPVLRAELEPLLAGRPAASVVNQCGSGVTACHNLLAMEHAGLAGSLLYAGSWSEWVADPSRPVAVGDRA